MKEADEALSRRALASTEVPSGALTRTRQVMSSEFDLRPMAVLEVTMSLCGVTIAGDEFTF